MIRRMLAVLLSLSLLILEAPSLPQLATAAGTPCAATFQQVYSCDASSVLRLHVAHMGGAISEGSSFVVAADASGTYLLTNEHVVLGATPSNLQALAPDGKTRYPVLAIRAQPGLTGTLTDLAVVKLAPTSLRPLLWGDSNVLQVGQPVASIGYGDPFDLTGPPSFTQGSVSQVQRDLGRCHGGRGWIQHQTPINHGSSGGPLLDERGQVVGVNTLSLDQTNACSGGSSFQVAHELYFAIPSNMAKAEAATLIATLSPGNAHSDTPSPPPSGVPYSTNYFTFLAPSTWLDADKYAQAQMQKNHTNTFSGVELPSTGQLPIDWLCERDVNGALSELPCHESAFDFFTADHRVSVEVQPVAYPDSAPRLNGLVAQRYFEQQLIQANTLGLQQVVRKKTTTYTMNELNVTQTVQVWNNTTDLHDAIAVATPNSRYALLILRAVSTTATARDIENSTIFLKSVHARGFGLTIQDTPHPLPPTTPHSSKYYTFVAPSGWVPDVGASPVRGIELPLDWRCTTVDADRIYTDLPCHENPSVFSSPDHQIGIAVQPITYPDAAPRMNGLVTQSYFAGSIIAANTIGALGVARSEITTSTVNGLPVMRMTFLMHIANTAPDPAAVPYDVFAVAPASSAHALLVLRAATKSATARDIEESNIFVSSVRLHS